MRVGDALLALAVAAAGFVVVAAVVTEVASAAVEFSLFVGLPAGALAGLLAGPLAFLLLGSGDPGRRRAGGAVAAAAVAFLGGLVSLTVAGGLRNSLALPAAAALALVAGVAAYARLRRSAPGGQ